MSVLHNGEIPDCLHNKEAEGIVFDPFFTLFFAYRYKIDICNTLMFGKSKDAAQEDVRHHPG